MKKINTISDISEETKEGQLLMAAIGTITTLPGFTDKTPEQTLQHIKTVAWHMYGFRKAVANGPETADDQK
jgi:hypothetical protein